MTPMTPGERPRPDHLDAVTRVLQATRFRYPAEDQLQQGVAAALAAAGLPAEREVRLPGAGRIDVMSEQIGVEVKVAGQRTAVERQLRRYATSGMVDGLVLVTNRARHRAMPAELDGVPLRVVFISAVIA